MRKFVSRGYLFIVLAFIYAPIFVLTVYSFTSSTTIGIWSGFSLDLYKKLFTDDNLRKVITDTLLLAFGAAFFSTVLGSCGAIGIFYSRNRLGGIVKRTSKIPIINAEIVTAISLALLFSIFGERSYFGLFIGHLLLCAPFVILSVTPKLAQMDPNLYEAALDLGATPFQALMKVVVPEILPGIFSGFMLSVTLSLDDYIITSFTKPATFDTISTVVYNSMKTPEHADLPAFRALTAIIFAIAVLILILNVRNSKRRK